jgi:hypothetical protein
LGRARHKLLVSHRCPEAERREPSTDTRRRWRRSAARGLGIAHDPQLFVLPELVGILVLLLLE